METIGQRIEELKGTEHGTLLAREVAAASRIRGGRSFLNIEVASREEMGEAAGDFNTVTKKVRVREDTVDTIQGVRKLIKRVLVHEDRHKGNELVGDEECHNEGMVEKYAAEATDNKPVEAYANNVEDMDCIEEEIGETEYKKAACQKNAEVLLTMALVLKFVERAMDVEAAVEKAESLVEAAA